MASSTRFGMSPSASAAAACPWRSKTPSVRARELLDGSRLGEAVLTAIDEVATGVQGELRGVTEGLSLLRIVRLEGVARRTALELMLLERRG